MAEKKYPVEFELLERQYVEKALEMLKKSLTRSLANEMAGSQIYHLRQQEIGAIDKLIFKVATSGG